MSKKNEEKEEPSSDELIEKIAVKVTEKLAARQPQPIHAYSACPQCGYQFVTQTDEDKHDECPNCQYRGRTVKLRWGND